MNYIENLENEAIKIMELTFDNCYSCTRVWSAFFVGTMTQDDFLNFDKDNESFSECFNDIKSYVINNKFSENDFYDKVIDIVSGHELYFNSNIYNNFNSESFNDDIFGIVDLKDMYIKFKEYKESLNLENNIKILDKDGIKQVRKNKIKP